MRYFPQFYPKSVKSLQTWYISAPVKFEMIKSTYNREVAFIVPSWEEENMKRRTLRMLRVHNVSDLDYHISATKMFRDSVPYNMYYSLMRYVEGIPKGNSNYSLRDWEEWNKTHTNEAIGYDLMVDIDSPNHNYLENAYHSAKTLKWYYDKNNIPYYLIFSGCGFHFITPSSYLPSKSFNPLEEDNIYKWCRKFAVNLYDNFSEMVDINIYDSRRVCKIPYSLSFYKNDCFVCAPFNSEEEFNNFEYEDYRPENYKFTIRGRGKKLFNPNGNLKEVKI